MGNRGVTHAPGRTGPPAHSRVRSTRVGLQFPKRALAFDHWQRVGAHLVQVADSTAWCLGDWLAYGEAQYADRYRRALDLVGLNYQTLRNYAWIARRFPMSRRRDTLTFNHHMEVARLTADEQDRWLDLAVEQGWSVHQLRRQLKQSRQPEQEFPDAPVLPKISADRDRIDRWRAAAERSSASLENWVVASLDQVADQVLDEGET
ncbi:LmbU family transcriptional regulator [Lentzea tibetensis]|uniref:LmbU family transcriptional regulator n=1 Tax=Lentzea tibetensis TaxID=2591470 RepID=UPI0022A7FCF9|nr:LmbU family transcriptional regulator [Lentzea tibetensis]